MTVFYTGESDDEKQTRHLRNIERSLDDIQRQQAMNDALPSSYSSYVSGTYRAQRGGRFSRPLFWLKFLFVGAPVSLIAIFVFWASTSHAAVALRYGGAALLLVVFLSVAIAMCSE